MDPNMKKVPLGISLPTGAPVLLPVEVELKLNKENALPLFPEENLVMDLC
jgi:hypothetical protein